MPASKKSDSETNLYEDAHMTEWQSARDLLTAYDNNLHDLRKFGFTFLTGLLAAESILLPSTSTSSTGSTGLPEYVKLGVFLVTLLLVFTLHLIDENYLVFEQAASTRALVLERELNLELTEVIGNRYQREKVGTRVLWVYLLFVFGVFLLGYFVFIGATSELRYDFWLAGGSVVAGGGILLSRHSLKPEYRFSKEEHGSRDWSLGLISRDNGDFLTVTLTNLNTDPDPDFHNPSIQKPITFPPFTAVWRIVDEQGHIRHQAVSDKEIRIHDNFTWLWDTRELGIGVYQVEAFQRPIPLGRKIIVTGPPPAGVHLA